MFSNLLLTFPGAASLDSMLSLVCQLAARTEPEAQAQLRQLVDQMPIGVLVDLVMASMLSQPTAQTIPQPASETGPPPAPKPVPQPAVKKEEQHVGGGVQEAKPPKQVSR
jgi:hypothetical protein